MTANDSLYEAKFDEGRALRRELARLREENDSLREETAVLRVQLEAALNGARILRQPKKPVQHPGQMVIEAPLASVLAGIEVKK